MENTLKPKTSAKDFFMWLGAMVALYVSTVSLILLSHQYIDIWLPDATRLYGDPYSAPIRFAIASLVVMYPLFMWLMRNLHVDIRKNPEKKELWVRRWLVYLTLFVAGLTMAIDIISVIYVYLQGDLSTRFALKALAIFLILGAAFWYYLEEIKNTWESKVTLSNAVAGLVSLIALVAVVSSFFVIGSPETARLLKIDDQKTADLQNIQWQVVNYWQQKGKLPGTVSDMEDPLTGFTAPKDPETGMPYTYTPGEGMSFKLCATFKFPSRGLTKEIQTRPTNMGVDENWQHGEGEQCFERVIDLERFPILLK